MFWDWDAIQKMKNKTLVICEGTVRWKYVRHCHIVRVSDSNLSKLRSKIQIFLPSLIKNDNFFFGQLAIESSFAIYAFNFSS